MTDLALPQKDKGGPKRTRMGKLRDATPWFQLTILLFGVLAGAFGQGVLGGAEVQALKERHDRHVEELQRSDERMRSAAESEFRDRFAAQQAMIESMRRDVTEILQRVARIEGGLPLNGFRKKE